MRCRVIWSNSHTIFNNLMYDNGIIYICSDRMNLGIYIGYCYWDGDYRLYTKQVADSGPVSPSDLELLMQ